MDPTFVSELKKLHAQREDPGGPLPLEDTFEIVEVGCNGELDVVPRDINNRSVRSNQFNLSKLPNGLPPIFPSSHQDLEEYLIHPEELPIHNFYESQRFWPREQNPRSLFKATFSPVLTTLKVQRNPKTGALLGYEEVGVSNADRTGKNSTSLLRQPDSQHSEVKGISTNIPFKPGGLDEPDTASSIKEETNDLDFDKGLLSIPPGFSQQISFKKDEDNNSIECSDVGNVVNIADILSGDVYLDEGLLDVEEDQTDTNKSFDSNQLLDETDAPAKDVTQTTVEPRKSDSLENLFIKSEDGIAEKDVKHGDDANEEIEDWAVMVNVKDPVKDFNIKVPDMAKSFSFELDTFQKQAVIHLENKECVFVAAHTSAGKTVVAEYAIALAGKHMTKTIYTSPIKALSNQKFRDFTNTFESVGLITGDVQINPEASCLVMTTEILRSMLYRGSRVIRDTEWVIFDEVHYVNDAERGVVWEEVLIMLPEHVNIIMLSATVPNTKEFAGWVGRIKKKKIYVISTTKRPVPLEYFLYTGNSTKTSDELFQIVDTAGKFLTLSHKKAVDAKSQRGKKTKDSYGAKGTRSHASPNEERNVWMSIVRKLEKEEGLPVVAFTFSRTRCNENADKLSGLDLTTSKEKHEIHAFIQKCISRLKDQDAQLPQVKRTQQLLERGLAVHHSGILPILKEMIEMLFQRGKVKLLFATETFAMGVNMPTRTVIFDSIRKHDGTKFRDLLPGEFVQMAGRAGRRGLDKTGTVIILCKADVPEMSDLQKMMLGKPTFLESRFRLTYSMILNLLRTEDLCVEDMMKRSFAEFHLLKKAPERERMTKEIEKKLENFTSLKCSKCDSDITDYYDICQELARLRKSLQLAMVFNGQKVLTPGRLIIIKNANQDHCFGIILKRTSSYSSVDVPLAHQKKTYSVLIICDTNDGIETNAKLTSDDVDDIVQPYVKDIVIYCPERPCEHKILEISEDNIVVITTQQVDVNSETIINDYNKRSLPRFRDAPPGQSVTFAAEELLRLSESNPKGLPAVQLNIKDPKIKEETRRQEMLESRIQYFECVECLCFEEHFEKYREEKILRDQLSRLKKESSLEMLTLIPEYKSRRKVLGHLGYLNENGIVEMKGRIACEISNHEIVISTLMVDGFFNDLEPAEAVALLSCFVFEQRRCQEPELTKRLLEGKERIEKTAKSIADLEKYCGMDTSEEDYLSQFKFGLVEVVFNWAKGMPFYEITGLTDVQEGIIVRCIQRLNELCHDVGKAAKLVGAEELQIKMDEASKLLKRDIVFAASLYTHDYAYTKEFGRRQYMVNHLNCLRWAALYWVHMSRNTTLEPYMK